MKILHKYVLKEHLGPLIFALATLTSLLLLNYIAKQFGNLVGKGIPWTAILEFFALSVPFTVALTFPMAVLVSTLYAFGRLAAENEITALKASGVSLRRILAPVLWAAVGVTVFMIFFNDQIMPRSNHRLARLQSDIAQKKPTVSLREQIINEVQRGKLYLRASHIDESSNRMRQVTIYDLSDPRTRRTIYADSGDLALSKNQSDLLLTLFHGTMQDVPRDGVDQLQRLYFNVDHVTVKGVGNSFQQSSTDQQKYEREMTVCEMSDVVDGAWQSYSSARQSFEQSVMQARMGGVKLPKSVLSMSLKAPPRFTLGHAYCQLMRKVGLSEPAKDSTRRTGLFGPMPTPPNAASMPALVRPPVPRPLPPTVKPVVKPVVPPVTVATTPRAGTPTHIAAAAPKPTTPSVAQRATPDSASRVASNTTASKTTTPKTSAVPNAAPNAAASQHPPGAPKPSVVPHTTVPPRGVIQSTPKPGAHLPPRPPGFREPQFAEMTPSIVAMQQSSMNESLDTVAKYDIEIHKKFALAVACFVFVLLGAPIALRFPRGGVGLTIGVSLFVFALYYVGLIAGASLAEKRLIPAWISMWAANVLFTLAALYLLRSMGKEGSTARGGDMAELWEQLRGKVQIRRKAA